MLTIPCIKFFIYVHISIDTNTVCTADMIKIDMVNDPQNIRDTYSKYKLHKKKLKRQKKTI